MKGMIKRLLRGVVWIELLICCGWPRGVAAGEGRVVDLAEGVRLAMEKNEHLLMARVDLSRSRQQVRQARADGLPQLVRRYTTPSLPRPCLALPSRVLDVRVAR